MFQCHFSEHMEQGLMGWFNVLEEKATTAGAGPSRKHGDHAAQM
jgi:hypothetical protein